MNDLSVEDSLLEQFTCPVCVGYMEKKIYVCSNGHSICGSCNLRLVKCPVCKVKLHSVRNITLEKAAKKVQEWKAKQDFAPVYLLPLKRNERLSLGSPITKDKDRLCEQNLIQCPQSKCCYSTHNLLQLKLHLQTFHSEQLYPIKKSPSVKSEEFVRVRLHWSLSLLCNMFIITISEAFFVIYIVRARNCFKKSSFYVNVLTISNQTTMFKFSCGTSTKFCAFYQSKYQAQDGIELDDGSFETICKGSKRLGFVKIYITKVATLHGMD